jgi:hypothetical protein
VLEFLRANVRPQTPTPLPLFPLRTVLFPGGLLPLKVFEQRYVDDNGLPEGRQTLRRLPAQGRRR